VQTFAASRECEAVDVAPFSSAELLCLFSRDLLAEAASKIELFHAEDEPRIVCVRGATRENSPQTGALGFVRFHRRVGLFLTLQTARQPNDAAIVRFAYPAPGRDRSTPFEG